MLKTAQLHGAGLTENAWPLLVPPAFHAKLNCAARQVSAASFWSKSAKLQLGNLHLFRKSDQAFSDDCNDRSELLKGGLRGDFNRTLVMDPPAEPVLAGSAHRSLQQRI